MASVASDGLGGRESGRFERFGDRLPQVGVVFDDQNGALLGVRHNGVGCPSS